MEAQETKIVFEIEVRDALEFSEIIQDIPSRRREEMEWVATDVIEVWSEDLSEEIECRLDEVGMPFTKTVLN